MTKTVRIVSILAAFIVVILVAFPVVFSSEMSEDIKIFLNSPGILEKYKNAKNTVSDNTESPLVIQAKAFALYLDPPKPKSTPKPQPVVIERPAQPAPKPVAPVKPKFDLEGTSYFAEKPELSLALINEPGKGLRWIRQSSKIGHLVVKEVLDGKIVIQDDSRTYEMEPKRPPQKSLIKNDKDSTKSVSKEPQPVTEIPAVNRITEKVADRPGTRTVSNRNRTVSRDTARPKAPELTPAQIKLMDEFSKSIENIDDLDEIMRQAEIFNEKFEELSEISDEEAENIKELGRELSESDKEK
ncbi:MAG: hypothetical protein JW804_07125 [Sedimentisphaerales bacterium]|nr:hypothetical protein [Sedimentisphaerales bacterium]